MTRKAPTVNDQHRPAGYGQHPAHGPHGYPAGWQHPHSRPARNGLGTAGFVLGILAALSGLVWVAVPVLGILVWPLAAVAFPLALAGWFRTRSGDATNRGQAVAGLALSIFAALLAIGGAAALSERLAAAPASAGIADNPGLGQADPSYAVYPPTLVPHVEPTTPADGIPGTGTFIVGTDVEPGTYRSSPAPGRALDWCYWSRLSGLDGTVDSIIANDGGDGPKVVEIAAGDVAFETSGCATWERVG